MEFNKFDNDTLINQILPSMDMETLQKLCRGNKRLARLCNTESMWRQKIYKDFGLTGDKPPSLTWPQASEACRGVAIATPGKRSLQRGGDSYPNTGMTLKIIITRSSSKMFRRNLPIIPGEGCTNSNRWHCMPLSWGYGMIIQ